MTDRRQSSIPAIEPPSGSSGRTSKNASPTRPTRSQSIVEQENNRSSNTHASPTRAASSAASVPSAAAIQRALSATRAGSASGDGTDRKQRSAQNVPHWPVSPRLKSPPPVSLRSIPGRRVDVETSQSSPSVRRLAPISSTDLGAAMFVPPEISKDSSTTQPTFRGTGRGASTPGLGLATVNEGSVPSASSMSSIPRESEASKTQPSAEQNSSMAPESSTSRDSVNTTAGDTTPKAVAEKSETAPASRATSTSRPATHLARRSLTSLTAKGKPVVEPLRTITVETETVNSTPQVIPERGRDGGSIRTRPSVETIRPRKEKKKLPRKAPSLHAGTNSSKADIFEAKVASAVDEADSTDSDETFVYESNPPEIGHNRHHSRTPSATSLASQVDHYGTRGKHGVRGNNTSVGGKKSMKFSNSIYGSQLEAEGAGDGHSSTRNTSSTARHHHIGRHGRNGHPSIIDTNSPFTQSQRASSPRTPTARNSRPSSPRTSNGRLHFSRKAAAAGYDAYDDGADDERAPLLHSVRVSRNRHSRRPNSSHFRTMQFVEDEDSTCWPRCSGCFFLGLLVTIVCVVITIFIVLVNRTLTGVGIIRIQNVLASEQELMLDMLVGATNPNIFSVTVDHLDISIFAESPHVGLSFDHSHRTQPTRMSLTERRQMFRPQGRRIPFWFPPFDSDGGVDKGTDPDKDPSIGDPEIDDPGVISPKMLLGQVCYFDSPLTFEATPFSPRPTMSVGSIKLTQPGNGSEIDGVKRWQRILGHPFDLIVRGVIVYQLPLSSSTRTAQISGRVGVTPDGDDEDSFKLLTDV